MVTKLYHTLECSHEPSTSLPEGSMVQVCTLHTFRQVGAQPVFFPALLVDCRHFVSHAYKSSSLGYSLSEVLWGSLSEARGVSYSQESRHDQQTLPDMHCGSGVAGAPGCLSALQNLPACIQSRAMPYQISGSPQPPDLELTWSGYVEGQVELRHQTVTHLISQCDFKCPTQAHA